MNLNVDYPQLQSIELGSRAFNGAHSVVIAGKILE